ncbi:AMP-binding protein [Thalassotalea psychrophila]|uniref:AMP-binding protein n=1 Tax=Thalassotalea psychrophila TaxID=3065647 RepID=A0ABY9U5S0_9GAMM|nr:AMP-binding protein [Colwelliaceae bacterium SQ149]
MSIEIQQPLERLYYWEANKPEEIYLKQSYKGEFIEFTWGEVARRARQLAAYLLELNYPVGSRIAIYSQNSPDWFIADFAIMMSGHVSVPLYTGQSMQSMQYVLNHSDCQLILLGQADSPQTINKTLSGMDIKRVALMGCETQCDVCLVDIVENYQPIPDSPLPSLNALYSLMYTSGTTGNPKGVMHHFDNVSLAVTYMAEDFKLTEKSRFFSYLPLSHTAERVLVLLYSLYTGGTVAFPESMETFNSDLKRAKPTFFFSVPRLWQKFKEAIESKISPEAMETMLNDPDQNKVEGFKQQIRTQLGLDCADIIITGSSPTPLELQLWYQNLGMALKNGYGMTENCIHGCICLDNNPVAGTVGKPFNGCEVKIGADNEILFKSKALMKGYYLEPERTAEVLRDGYYHTGDTGMVDEQGLLHVTGRLSEVFKTTKGKFVKPTNIENILGNINCLGQMCVIGHGLDSPFLLAGLSELGKDMDKQSVTLMIEAKLQELNPQLESFERVKQVLLVKDEWTIENELLTPTMKLRRNSISARYISIVNALPADQGVNWQ